MNDKELAKWHQAYVEYRSDKFLAAADGLDEFLAEAAKTAAITSHVVTRARLPRHDPKLLRALSESQPRLQSVDSRFFEELVFDLLVAQGYKNAKLIPRLNAKGPDIIAINPDDGGTTVVEVKRWKARVNVDVIRCLVAVIEHEIPKPSGAGQTKGLIVTSSTFTRDARLWVKNHLGWQMSLLDYQDLRRMLADALTPMEVTVRHHRLVPGLREMRDLLDVLKDRGSFDCHFKNADHLCPHCGGDVICAYFRRDSGTGGWMDDMDEFNYFHACRACLFTVSTWQSFTLDLWAHEGPIHVPCPFCEDATTRMIDGLPQWGNIRFHRNDVL